MSILVVLAHHDALDQCFFHRVGLEIVTGSRYLRGYIGYAGSRADWLGYKFWY